ncbi:hypothetical protein U1Q18_044191 [Sarracenia purpurea var. burkii]
MKSRRRAALVQSGAGASCAGGDDEQASRAGPMLGEDSGAATRWPRFEDERDDCALLIPKPSKLVVGEGDSVVGNRDG